MTMGFGDAVNVISFGVGFSGIAGRAYDTFVATSPSESLLEQCRKDLEEVKSRLNELTPEEREEIDALAERKKYKSLETIERELTSDRCELSERSAKASFVERSVPLLSKLLGDIKTLRNAIKALQSDTWNTTTSPSKEARKRAQARLEQGASGPQPPPPSVGTDIPSVGPRHQSTSAQSSTIGPQAGQYQLDDLCPTTDHTAAREDATKNATALPSGLV